MRQNRHAVRQRSSARRPASSAPPLRSRNGGKKTEKTCCCELIIRKPASRCTAALLQSGQFANMLLRTTDNETKAAHQWIILGLSPLLLPVSATAGSGETGSCLPVVDIQMASNVVDELLNLAYTGSCQLSEELLIPLLEAANSLHIQPLLRLCGDYLLKAASDTQQPACLRVRHLRLARQYLCHHVVEGLAREIRRRFPDHISSGGAAFLLSPQELALLLAKVKSDVPLREKTLLEFILAASAVGAWDITDTRCLLQYVRYTLLTKEELEELMTDERMAPFLVGRPHAVVPLCRVLQSQGLLPPADSRLRQRTVVLPTEEARLPRQVVAVMGGWGASPPGPTEHVETYNHVTNTWRALELKLPVKRAYHGLVLCHSQVYLIGGYDADGPTYHKSAYVLELSTQQWRQLPSMLFKRCYIATVLYQNKILALGGHDGTARHSSVEAFDPELKLWSDFPSMTSRRSDLAVVVHAEKVYAIGGFTGEEVLSSVEVYDPTQASWSFLTNLSTRRSGVSAVALGDRIYVLGGFDGQERLKSVECFTAGSDPRAVKWHPVPDMITPRSNFSVVVLEGKILVTGGYIEPTVSGLCEVYCPIQNTWSRLPHLQLERSALNQVVITWDNTQDISAFI